MLSPVALRLRWTHSSAESTCARLVSPSEPATLRLTMRAPGATPAKPVTGSRPAIRPARWVPWPKVSSVASRRLRRSEEKSGPWITRPGSASEPTGTTPESISATSTPAPRGAPATMPLPPAMRSIEVVPSSARAEAGSRSTSAASPRAAIRAGFGLPRPSQRIP